MRIFFITHTYSLEGGGGGEVNVAGILRQLCKDNEVFLFTPDCPHFAEEKKLGLQVYRAKAWGHPAFHKIEYALQAGKAVELARKFRPDVIHAHNDVFPALIGDRIKKKLKIPLSVYIECISKKTNSWNMKMVYETNRFFLPKINADVMISMSKFNADNYLIPWGIPKEKIPVIPAGIDTEKMKPVKPDSKLLKKYGKHILVSMRPLHTTHAKGIAWIIRAMKIVHKKHPKYKYLIFGDGSGKQMLQELVKELGLEDTVKFPGAVAYEKVRAIYCASEFMVHSFSFETSTSISLIDSLACGRPVIATDSGEIKYAFGEAAIIVPQEDEKALADAMNRLIESPKLRKQMEKKSRKLAVERYSIGSVAKMFEKEFAKIAKKGARD